MKEIRLSDLHMTPETMRELATNMYASLMKDHVFPDLKKDIEVTVKGKCLTISIPKKSILFEYYRYMENGGIECRPQKKS